MKKLISIITMIAVTSAAYAADVSVTANISANTTWSADNAYLLGQPIFVTDGAVLTIEPGTKIYGFKDIANQTFGSLIITRGCQIIADGTPTQPIVFTALVGIGDGEEMNLGFIIIGTEPQTVYITVRGPSLPVPTPLDDTILTLFSGGVPIEVNSVWKESPNRGLIEATTLAPSDDLEAAIVITLPPGTYTALVESESGNEGIAIGEVFIYR